MRHIRGIVRKQQVAAVERLGGPLAGMVGASMVRRRHVPATFHAGIWSRLSQEQQARVEACLEDACREYGCPRAELVWAMDRGGIVHVKKRERIAL
jgi:hypothetical protein